LFVIFYIFIIFSLFSLLFSTEMVFLFLSFWRSGLLRIFDFFSVFVVKRRFID